MKSKLVNSLMVPISDYATIHEDANMQEAMQAFENGNKRYGKAPYRHQSLVVLDSGRQVIGRLSQVDMMRALEPRYRELGESRWIARSPLSKKVLTTLHEQFQLWEQPLEVMCRAMEKAKVKDYMQEPTEGEFVSPDDPLTIAAHRIVMGHHHSLLVTRGREILGILRSTDLFNALYDMMTECR